MTPSAAPRPAANPSSPQAPRTISWGGLIEQPAPGAGPHRIRAVSACAAETGGRFPDDASSDPLGEPAPAGGLREFDLGTVPASVTPPPSSRRAAWFAVASAGAAFGGLLLVAATLVTPHTSIDGLRLPEMPRATRFPAPEHDRPLAEPRPSSRPAPSAEPRPLPGEPPPGARPDGREPRPGPPVTAADLDAAAPEAAAPPRSPEGPAELPSEPSPEPRPAPPITYRGELLTLADPEVVAARSNSYFAAIRDGDLRSAYAMTAGRLRADGFAAFAAPYRDATSIEVLAVSAASSSTVTSLRITRPGGVVEERRRLRFSAGAHPRITADAPA
ncbi:hypothetical protein ACL03H_19785 [Saccharopolyspora sp. MS10]|uniref:hypothetical protein n=1 Tax=Saccharopolyspora sp. MS10 TaxID=3385973 RepID=UPI00399FF2C4